LVLDLDEPGNRFFAVALDLQAAAVVLVQGAEDRQTRDSATMIL
jgi:hypothetical protein